MGNFSLLLKLLIRRILRRATLVCFLLVAFLYFLCTITHPLWLNTWVRGGNDFVLGTVSGRLSPGLSRTRTKTFLLVCILTGPSNTEARAAARKSWLKLETDPHLVQPLFIVGGQDLKAGIRRFLDHELKTHQDLLILETLVDSYANLTLKILQMYSWIDSNIDFEYVLKLDDDSFARIDLISLHLKQPSVAKYQQLYWGFFDGRARPFKKGKWSEKDWNLCDLYVPYALGGGYVISRSLVTYLGKNAPHLRLFFNEDVSLGTWLAPVNVHRQHDVRFDTEFKSRGCSNSYLITHKQTPKMLIEKAENLKTFGFLCGGKNGEFRARMSYNYNWTVPPSQCCHRGKNGLP